MPMQATDTLEQIASMLPKERKERFLLMCSRFKTVPEDDEYLLMMEAVCLMTLLWKEVPHQIQEVLVKAAPANSNNEQLLLQLKKVISESIPSYEDLLRISERLESHEVALKRALDDRPNTKSTFSLGSKSLIFLAGALTILILDWCLRIIF